MNSKIKGDLGNNVVLGFQFRGVGYHTHPQKQTSLVQWYVKVMNIADCGGFCEFLHFYPTPGFWTASFTQDDAGTLYLPQKNIRSHCRDPDF